MLLWAKMWNKVVKWFGGNDSVKCTITNFYVFVVQQDTCTLRSHKAHEERQHVYKILLHIICNLSLQLAKGYWTGNNFLKFFFLIYILHSLNCCYGMYLHLFGILLVLQSGMTSFPWSSLTCNTRSKWTVKQLFCFQNRF